MRAARRQPLFDEWAILTMSAKSGGVNAYQGPRAELFLRNLQSDAEPLRKRAAGKQFAEADIEFSDEGTGTKYDAFMKIGATSYLVLNHTEKTMVDIRADEKWLAAQAVLFELSEKFRADPLEI
jgi:hypothetical protein